MVNELSAAQLSFEINDTAETTNDSLQSKFELSSVE